MKNANPTSWENANPAKPELRITFLIAIFIILPSMQIVVKKCENLVFKKNPVQQFNNYQQKYAPKCSDHFDAL